MKRTKYEILGVKYSASLEEVKQALREEIEAIFDEVDSTLNLNTKPSVILVVGVNGVGKTTSIGKIANKLKKDGIYREIVYLK